MKSYPANGCRWLQRSARFFPHPCCRHFHTLCRWIEVEEGNTWQWLTVTHPLRPSQRSPLFLRARPAPPLNSARLRRWILNLNTERFTYKSRSCMQIFFPFPFHCRTLISFPIFPPCWCLLLIFLKFQPIVQMDEPSAKQIFSISFPMWRLSALECLLNFVSAWLFK